MSADLIAEIAALVLIAGLFLGIAINDRRDKGDDGLARRDLRYYGRKRD